MEWVAFVFSTISIIASLGVIAYAYVIPHRKLYAFFYYDAKKPFIVLVNNGNRQEVLVNLYAYLKTEGDEYAENFPMMDGYPKIINPKDQTAIYIGDNMTTWIGQSMKKKEQNPNIDNADVYIQIEYINKKAKRSSTKQRIGSYLFKGKIEAPLVYSFETDLKIKLV